MVPQTFKEIKLSFIVAMNLYQLIPRHLFYWPTLIIILPLVTKNFDASEVQRPFKVVNLFQFGTEGSGHNRNYQLFPKN